MDILSKVKKSIRGLKAYDPGLTQTKYKLDANENPYDVPAVLKKAILKKAQRIPFNRYPDAATVTLKKNISKYLGVKTENIFVGNGSDEIIEYLMQTFVEQGDTVIVPTPTFEMYRIIGVINGAKIIELPLDKKFDIDEKAIITAVKKTKAKFVFLAYPNNPTGNCFSENKIMKIIEGVDCFVVLDEAYYDFSGRSFLKCLKRHKNLIILRTFSKAFSMAALRMGYMIADRETVAAVNKVRLPYNINSLSQFVAVELLKADRTKVLEIIIKERKKLYALIKEKYECVDSNANFIFLKPKTPSKAQKVFEAQSISVRVFTAGPAAGWMRLTVGTPAENKLVRQILKRGV